MMQPKHRSDNVQTHLRHLLLQSQKSFSSTQAILLVHHNFLDLFIGWEAAQKRFYRPYRPPHDNRNSHFLDQVFLNLPIVCYTESDCFDKMICCTKVAGGWWYDSRWTHGSKPWPEADIVAHITAWCPVTCPYHLQPDADLILSSPMFL